METGIRIKFTPLIKTVHRNNSRCILEIIPELTVLENIENINWNNENDFIEYIVPIKYKIVLKKMTSAITNEYENKIYYSCVDLLHRTSKNNLYLGSGDVSRIISDNLIFRNYTYKNKNQSEITVTKDHTLILKKDYKVDENKNTKSISKETTKRTCKSKYSRENKFNDLSDYIYTEDTKIFGRSLDNTVKNHISFKIKTSEKHTKGNIIKDKGELNEIINDNHIINSQPEEAITVSIRKSQSKLTLSPVSLYNNVKPLLKIVYQNTFYNSNICFVVDTEESIQKNNIGVKQSNILNNYIDNEITKANCEENNNWRLRSKLGVTPALRINYYIQVMEKEILPLKILLHDIINKCNVLGLSLKTKLLQRPISNPNKTICYKENEFASNRVVYSVVSNK
ncbi:unnamed protein product [Parnassius mnemosyne]|uniref:Uncharacterized protein n=1 Tax=Parnassius mnemosyne TaxID=213953 RepID=A0AAV1M0E0_9NEOP